MNQTPEDGEAQASRGIRQAHPERVGLAPGKAAGDVPADPPPHAAAPVRGEAVEPSPHTAPPVRGEPVESTRHRSAPAFESLHPYARWGMRLSTMLLLALPSAGPSAVLLTNWDDASLALRLGVWFGILIVALAAGWALGGVRFSRTGFALDDAGLRIRRGLWWRSETLVPRSRVQHTDINHGPLDRRLGLATLRVYTAGTRLASVALDGLPEARALELRDALVTADPDVV